MTHNEWTVEKSYISAENGRELLYKIIPTDNLTGANITRLQSKLLSVFLPTIN